METTYDKLVKSAIRLMTEKGYSGTSIGMLAEDVGVSKSTVIHYFKTKEGILLGILEDFFPAAIKELKYILNQSNIDAVEKLRKLLHFQMNLVADAGDIFTLVIRETRYLGNEYKKTYETHHRQYESLFLKVIEEIQSENKEIFYKKDPKIVMKAVLGMCNYATVWYKKNGKFRPEEIAEQFFGILTGRDNL